ncbi:MAG: arsenate reductase ArsC [Alphaproteobacteria bacterium]|nr:arsenate reductase ArsC [Alphaproteobacteria bacterium]
MSAKPLIVLFVSTGNAARSIIAEALLNSKGSDRFIARSAGQEPLGEIHRETIALLRDQKISLDGLRPKSWKEFQKLPISLKPDVVVTLSEEAKQYGYIWGDVPVKAHWAVDNPLSAVRADIREWKFRKCFSTLEARITALVRARPAPTTGALFMQFKDLGMVV